MKYGKKVLFLPLVLLTLLTPFFAKTYAQTTSYDVTVSPVFFDLSVNPGGVVSDKLRVRNNTSSPLHIIIEVKRLGADNNGEVTLKDAESDNAASWISFGSRRITARPLEWTDIPFKISVPSYAAYGYYFAISLTQDNVTGSKTTGTTLTGAAAVPVLLNVRKEGAKAEAKLVKFEAKPYVNEYLPEDFEVTLQNTGNIHIHPGGNIFISGGGDKNIATLDVNPYLSNIIPNTRKTFTTDWNSGFIVREDVIEDGQIKLDKNGKPVKHLVINWDQLTNFRFGKYSANLVMVYYDGSRDIPIVASASFWVIPYKVIIGTLLGVIILILLIRAGIRRYIRRELRKRGA